MSMTEFRKLISEENEKLMFGFNNRLQQLEKKFGQVQQPLVQPPLTQQPPPPPLLEAQHQPQTHYTASRPQRRQVVCFSCDKIGHIARNCFHRAQVDRNSGRYPRFQQNNGRDFQMRQSSYDDNPSREDDMERFRTVQIPRGDHVQVIPYHLMRNNPNQAPTMQQHQQQHHQHQYRSIPPTDYHSYQTTGRRQRYF